MSRVPFQAFVDEHRGPVRRYLFASVGPDAADDCFQETFIAAMRAYPRLRANSNPRAWVLKIASNKAIDHHRARARRPLPSDEIEAVAGGHEDPDPTTDTALWSLVRDLPHKQRGAVVLRFVADLPHDEIARVLGCSPEAARRNLHEGLAKLRKGWLP